MPRRAVIYARQSIAREESISLELQETACRAHAAQQGYVIVAVETDEGFSGRTFDRPGVRRAMSMIEDGRADVILLWKWSRLSRSRRDWAAAADTVERAGGQIESATEAIDTTTSVGRLGRGIMVEFAAFESERIGDQWREAHERRIRNGRPHGGRPRFGYTYDKAEKIHRVDPVTGPILADIYRRYGTGASFHSIAQRLILAGIPSATGGLWHPTVIKKVCDSGFGAGRIFFRGQMHAGAHEPVIDEAMWAAYQEARARRRPRPRAENSQYLLSGMVWCASCSARMGGARFKGYAYYKCTQNTLTRAHRRMSVPTHVAEDAVLATIRDIAADVTISPGAPATVVDVDQLRAVVARERRALGTLTVRHVDGTLTADAYAAAAEVIQSRLDAAQAAVRAAEAAPVAPAVSRQDAVDLLADWDLLPVAALREGIRAVIARVEVDFEGEPRVTPIPVPGL